MDLAEIKKSQCHWWPTATDLPVLGVVDVPKLLWKFPIPGTFPCEVPSAAVGLTEPHVEHFFPNLPLMCLIMYKFLRCNRRFFVGFFFYFKANFDTSLTLVS